ncbi:MAG: hypothetical protein NTW52_09840 [Planctomycetota bacterium]|nr:hypothetical protein [Planctomycetota bacterium]
MKSAFLCAAIGRHFGRATDGGSDEGTFQTASSFEEEQCMFFELVWTDEADRRVYANWVVKSLDVVDHATLSTGK